MLTRFDFAQHMQKNSTRFFINICIAVLIFSNAEVGRLMGLNIHPFAISVVWPATGFSLAALLLYGFKAWPGVFLGNLCFNFIHFYEGSSVLYIPVLMSIIKSLGSLFQGLASAYVMQHASSRGYFNNIKDMLLFLIPAGVLSCMIAPTIGTTALYVYGMIPHGQFLSAWTAFWVGDSMGVYIFTPMIVVWSLYKNRITGFENGCQWGLMMVVFLGITWINFGLGYSMRFLYIPFILWVTYRLLLHGATVFIFLISLSVIISFVKGHFPPSDIIIGDPLLTLVLSLEVLVATALVFAGIIHEREAVLRILQRQNIDLRQSIELHVQERSAMDREISIQGTLGSLGFLTSHIARQLQIPLKAIANFAKGGTDCLKRLKKEILPQESKALHEEIALLGDYLENIVKFEDQATDLAHLVQEQSSLVAIGRVKLETIGLHDLLDECLDKISVDAQQQDPDFSFVLVKNFDSSVKMQFPLPEDLAPAFIPILNTALNSLRTKKLQLIDSYTPQLEVTTKEHSDDVEIIIRDNGIGLPNGEITALFHSFMSFTPPSGEGLGLSLAHDLIVYVYRGTISVDSKEAEFTQITITLPKIR